MFDLLDKLVPMVIFFMLFRGILDMLLGKKKRRSEGDTDWPEPQDEDDEQEQRQPEPQQDLPSERRPQAEQGRDLAAEFERRLKKTKTNAEDENPKQERQRIYVDKEQTAKSDRINPAREDKQRVHTDNEAEHDTRGRVRRDSEAHRRQSGHVHTDNEPEHDAKGRVRRDGAFKRPRNSKLYRDPLGDYSYDEEKFNAEVAAFSARYGQSEQLARPKLKLKHAALVNGYIMAQVLDKPRALKPYGEEQQL